MSHALEHPPAVFSREPSTKGASKPVRLHDRAGRVLHDDGQAEPFVTKPVAGEVPHTQDPAPASDTNSPSRRTEPADRQGRTFSHASPCGPGVPHLRRGHPRRFDHDEAISLLASGESWASVARKCGVNEASIRGLAARRGFVRQPPAGQGDRLLIEGPVAILDLGKGVFTVLDVEDVPLLGSLRWCAKASRPGEALYVQRRTDNGTVKLHRLITGASNGELPDHIDGDTLNNRRYNLRICDRFGNAQNRGINRNNTSGFKGVYKTGSRWYASIKHKDRKYRLGVFDDPADAARAYDAAASEIWGEYARLNFPTPRDRLQLLSPSARACVSAYPLNLLHLHPRAAVIPPDHSGVPRCRRSFPKARKNLPRAVA